MTTVKRGGARTPVSTGCGTSTRGTSKPSSGRTSVSSGCGTSGGGSTGWKPKTGGKTSGGSKVSGRSQDLLEKAVGKKKTTVSSGCGTGSPAKPSKPATHPSKPTRTGC